MRLLDFLNLSEGGYISPKDAADLNRELATKSLSDIAPDHRQNVLDYLLKAMEFDSVDHNIRGNINTLISDLQEAILA
ncbi:hypothetical protein ELG88_29405 (plasmid) [Rhizobium leguminosarum]|uniref:hypothetical protein n=1 Tax=Rhizobium leguminosarum TaxID=384 RepID=UPI00102FAE36|nr:hypothetical protein [Rhizobium leguminosarum]TBF26478.1 hypothetical protein ELG88_29405 [Rhizobium leguminosarum]